MAHENMWSSLEDGQPTGAVLLGQVDDYIRQTRQMVRERIALEHDFNFLINDQQGYHRQGSARVWVSDTQPSSPIPDPTSTETAGSETIGRCWFKPSTGEYFVYNNASASWIPVNLTTLQMAALLHAMTAKASLADNDEFALADSAATYGPKKTLWSTIKSVIKAALSIGGSHALSEDNIGDGVNYKRISATKADKINGGTYSEDDLIDGSLFHRVQAAKADKINGGTYSEDDIVDGTSYKRIQAAKADKINGGTYSEDDIVNGTLYHRVQAAKADKINGGTYSADDIVDGTSYKRIQATLADTINNQTRLPTTAGTSDANAIAAASGSTVGARIETLTGQVVKVVSLTAGADWVDITDWMNSTSSLHLVSSFDGTYYGINLFVVGAGRNGGCFVLAYSPSARQVLSFQTVLSGDYVSHKVQCKVPTYSATVTIKTIMANP